MRYNNTDQFRLSSPNPRTKRKFDPKASELQRTLIDDTAKCLKERAASGQRSGIASTRSKSDRLWLEADRLTKCGRNWRLEKCADCKVEYHAPVSCNSRICPRCSWRAARKYEAGLSQALAPLFAQPTKGKALMLVTLTVDSKRYGDALPDKDGFALFHRQTHQFFKLKYGKWRCKFSKTGRLVEDAARYRWSRDSLGNRIKERRKPITTTTKAGKTVQEWRQWRGSGAVIVSELGNSSGRPGYLNNNLHAHALVYGDYIPGRLLIEAWHRITGDSTGVHITAIRSLKAAVGYVLKYITKPPALDNPDGLAEWAEMIKGVRRLRTTGIFVNAIKKTQAEKYPHHCPKCGGFLCDCGETVIEKIDEHPSLSLYREQRQAVQMPPPVPSDPWKRAAAAWPKDDGITWL